jgi:SAM-dependent methyltransferase
LTAPGFSDRQRLAFGRVAELYDRARPAYPESAIAQVIAYAGALPGELVLEVGAGTGKATVMLAARGLRVLALEPDPAMAALARSNCAGLPEVEVRELAFEDYAPAAPARLVLAAQSWHWVRPDIRYQRAGASLAPGGGLAALWTLPRWEEVALRAPLREVYARVVGDMPASFPMHPAGRPDELAGDWRGEIAASGAFEDVRIEAHPWRLAYSAKAYAELIATHQDHILLAPERREELLAGIRAVIEREGAGAIEMSFATILCLARRTAAPTGAHG